MRYLVKAQVKSGKECALIGAIENETLGKGSIACDEYLYDMQQARLNEMGVAIWVETSFCDPPLAEERLYWEEYFDLLSVKDAHSRRNCRHENGTEPWACCDCDCTKKLEENCERRACHFSKNCMRARAYFTRITTNRFRVRWGAHAPPRAHFGALAEIPISRKVCDHEGAIANTRSACAPQIDYEQEHEQEFTPTHLRIMMRQFVP